MSTLERNSLRLVAATLLMAMAPAAAAQPYQALPIDEAHEVPSFAAWRDSLAEAVDSRDTEAVVAMAAPDILLSFGGHAGRETLRHWLIGAPDEPWRGEPYWRELESVLALGGGWMDLGDGTRHFCAPYTFVSYPEDLDPYSTVLFIREDAQLYEGPATEELPVATVGFAIAEVIAWVAAAEEPGTPYWVEVRTLDEHHHQGYAVSTDFRSPVDYRACFTEADDGSWTWDLFVAGD